MFKHYIIFITVLLAGCNSKYVIKEYTPPNNGDLVDVKFKAMDTYRNNDYIKISLLSRGSCSDKLNYETVGKLKSKRCFFDCSDIDKQYYTENRLPANRVLNIELYNKSDSGVIATRCNNLKSYKLTASQNYLMKINNWSTSGSTHSGFGCEFNIYAIGENNNLTKLTPVKPDIATCK